MTCWLAGWLGSYRNRCSNLTPALANSYKFCSAGPTQQLQLACQQRANTWFQEPCFQYQYSCTYTAVPYMYSCTVDLPVLYSTVEL